ncbi:hypothetical protein SDC9_156194 [bioreactor metagenome]|uniref:Uncharacterized protein n=1 Tax=bioreactor metagenome TaxID=1076179 RepID=A0A645F5K4_9ZZZZ
MPDQHRFRRRPPLFRARGAESKAARNLRVVRGAAPVQADGAGAVAGGDLQPGEFLRCGGFLLARFSEIKRLRRDEPPQVALFHRNPQQKFRAVGVAGGEADEQALFGLPVAVAGEESELLPGAE